MACGAKEDQVLDAGQAVVGRAWIRARALGARGDDVGDLGKLDRAAVLEFVPQEARRAFWAVRAIHVTGVVWGRGASSRRRALPAIGGRAPGVVSDRCGLPG